MIISFVGIPGSGKSSIVREISKIINTEFFVEPEEEQWPEIVTKRDVYGFFTGITWFRGIRIKQLYDAEQISQDKKLVILDTYYDKLIGLYLGKKGLDWLISKKDKYFDTVKKMSKTDYEILPNVDLIIFLKVSKNLWKRFISLRNRALDNETDFINSCFLLQKHLLNSVKKYCRDFNKQYLIINQHFSSPENMARIIVEKLKNEKIINNI